MRGSWGGNMRGARALIAVIAAFALLFLQPARAQPPRDPAAPSFAEVIANLEAANAGLDSFQAEQVIDVRLWVLRFRVLTTVYAARPGRYRIVVREAPAFLRPLGSVFQHVGAPEDLLALYAPEVIAYTDQDGRRLLRVAVAQRDRRANPPSGEMFVDVDRWLVERLRLRYEWGDVLAQYEYGRIDGYWLPLRVPVRIPRYGIEAVAAFRNYRLNVPLPDAVFSSGALPPGPMARTSRAFIIHPQVPREDPRGRFSRAGEEFGQPAGFPTRSSRLLRTGFAGRVRCSPEVMRTRPGVVEALTLAP